MDAIAVIGQHLKLTGRLFLRYGLLLTCIWAGSMMLGQILLHLAVEIGLRNRLLGLVSIAPLILMQMVVFVAFFTILRNGLPYLRLRRQQVAQTTPEADQTKSSTPFALALLAVLVPFYGYYAGWGLLNDTLRGYAQLFHNTQVARITDFLNPPAGLDRGAFAVGSTLWVVLAVLLIWAIRRGAQIQSARSGQKYWSIIIVACEATWALLGLYVISGWKDEFAAWLATLPSPQQVLDWAASAAVTDASRLPVDWAQPQGWGRTLLQLFWYAVLPLIWFNLGAIVYGHNMNAMRAETSRYAGNALRNWQALPKPVTDFVGHFWAGLIKRWHAVTNGFLLAASAGFALTASVLVLWRLVDWLGYWAWMGLVKLLGPHDILTWSVLEALPNALFNTPGTDTQTGALLIRPLQFCILAAGLELAGRAQERAAKATPEADAEPA